MSRIVIDDDMWRKLSELLPKPKGRHSKNDRLFLEVVCWIIRTGAPWRDLPRALVKQHQMIDIKRMGLSEGWESDPFWN